MASSAAVACMVAIMLLFVALAVSTTTATTTTSSALSTQSPATAQLSGATGRCEMELPLGITGKSISLSILTNATTATFTATLDQLTWFGFGFSDSGLMSSPNAARALILSTAGGNDPNDLALRPYLLENQTMAGAVPLSPAQAELQGIRVHSWTATTDPDVDSASFTAVVDLDAVRSPGFLLMAAGDAAIGGFDLHQHTTAYGSMQVSDDWLADCTANSTDLLNEDYCTELSHDYVCEACGRCSFELHVNDTYFGAYTERTGLELDKSLLVSADYLVSWRVHAPVPGYNVTAEGERPYIHLLLQAKTDGWLGFGFIAGDGNFGMEGTDIYWGGIDEDGELTLKDAWTFTIGVVPSDETWGGVQSTFDVRGARDDGILSVEFKRHLDTGDHSDVPITDFEEFPCVYAYSSGTDSFDMTRYHRYSRGFLRTQFYSVGCEPGQYLNPTDGKCELCPAGFACPDTVSISTCPPGTYADKPGMVACVSCDNSPNVGYSNSSAAIYCTDCPTNTERTIESSVWGGSRAEECVCKPGFYRPDRARGLPCDECPVGGFCAGGVALPRPLPGYWGIAEHPHSFTVCTNPENGACTLSTNLTVEGWFDTLDLDDDRALSLDEVAALPKAVPELAKLYDDGWALSSTSGDYSVHNVSYRDFLVLVDVDPTSSTSYVPFNGTGLGGPSMCTLGYSGEICAVCEEGYFRFAVNCYECPEDEGLAAAAMLAGVILVVALWYMVAQTANWLESDTFDLLLLFMQCMSIIMAFNLRFHEWIDPLAPLFSLSAFNMDILNPTCLIRWDYNFSSLLQLGLPVLLLAFAFSRVAIIRSLIARGHAGKYLCCGRFMLVPSDMPKVENSNIAAASSFLYLVYTELVLTSISPFRLIGLPDGRQVMKAAPFIEAWSTDHFVYQVVPGVLGILVYVLAVPILLLVYTQRLKKLHLLADDDTLDRFKWLYGKYHLKAFYWEIVILLRRFMLAVVSTVLDSWPFTQGMVALGFLVGLLCAQFYTLPFRRHSNNITDTVFITLLIAFNFAGMMFEADTEFPDFVAALVLLSLAAGMFFAVWLCTKEIMGTIRRRRGERRLRMPDKVLRLYAAALHEMFQKLSSEELDALAFAIAQSQHNNVKPFEDANTHGVLPVDSIVEDMEEDEGDGDDSDADAKVGDKASNKNNDSSKDVLGDLPTLKSLKKMPSTTGMLRKSSVMKWAEKNLAYEENMRRASSINMFPKMGSMQAEYEGRPETRPLLLHDAQAVIQKIAERAWEKMHESGSKNSELNSALQRYESDLKHSAEVDFQQYWRTTEETKSGVKDVVLKDGEHLLRYIVTASQTRVSLLWASEAFDMVKSRKSIKKQLTTITSRNMHAKRRKARLQVSQIVGFLKHLTVPKLEKDLRTCLKVHPWRGSSFVNFLTVHYVDGEVDVEAMEEFYRLQGWLSDYMFDTSDTSVFNDTPNAEFYRKLATNQPHLVDWLLQATPTQIVQFRNVMTDLELYAEHWDELKNGRPGLDIFNHKYDDDSSVSAHVRHRKSVKSRQPALAHKVVHRDFHASILHWLTFEEDHTRADHLHRLVKLLQSAKSQVHNAVGSRVSRRHHENIAKIRSAISGKRIRPVKVAPSVGTKSSESKAAF